MRFMIVVLPAPEAPIIAVDLPGSRAPDGPRMIVTPARTLELFRAEAGIYYVLGTPEPEHALALVEVVARFLLGLKSLALWDLLIVMIWDRALGHVRVVRPRELGVGVGDARCLDGARGACVEIKFQVGATLSP